MMTQKMPKMPKIPKILKYIIVNVEKPINIDKAYQLIENNVII